ncbi:MAG: 3-oxoacyl-ACP synthase [Saprospiraceae bacterium]
MQNNIGIVGTGIYLPETKISAKEISDATNGVWTEEAVINKLGINYKCIPGEGDGTQEMGAKAAISCLQNSKIDPLEIDLIISVGEEWKEYPLTTTGIYIQERIGANNAWSLDFQQRCNTTIAAMKIAKDMMIADENINTVLIAGGYRNGDFIDYGDSSVSFMFNLGAGGGALILKKNYGKNLLLGTHIITDGSLSRDAGVEFGGTENPITCENVEEAYMSLRVFNEKHMKDRLNEVSMKNWILCMEKAFEKSNSNMKNIDYLAGLHFKRRAYFELVEYLGLTPEQTFYMEDYGHIGQIDQIISIHKGLELNRIKEGDFVSMIAAGIGYAWGANVIKWG